VQAKIIKLVGLKNGGRLSPINLVTFAGTQNGEWKGLLSAILKRIQTQKFEEIFVIRR
jgi:hypothetical protein